MKKLFVFLLSLVMLFSFTACEKEDMDLALDIAWAVLEELENYEDAHSDVLPEYSGAEAESVEEIPPFSGDAYVAVNGNVPFFRPEEITDESYEDYAELDKLGRCGVTMACIGVDIMPTEDRGEIGSVKPTGWQSVKYDCVDGKYLYNRCHLIGFQLTGENANEQNLVTGTRYMNVDGMLPFENMVADYIKETGNHVLYRVTPVYAGDNLLCSGVFMEAYSVEDKGEGISFHVYCYNAQPGIQINYANGDSSLAPTQQSPASETGTYVLNTNSKKIHKPHCASVGDISPKNRKDYKGAVDSLLSQGYETCKSCF